MPIDLEDVARQLDKLERRFRDDIEEEARLYLPESLGARQRDFFRIGERIAQAARDEQPIRLVVAGGFSTGKSSVINSLIGEALIPTGPEPMTLAPSYFRYGESVEIAIEFTDGPPETISLEQFQTIKHTAAGDLPDRYRDIKMIHFQYPYPKLARVHIIDTPGFGTATARDDDQRTLDVIQTHADVVLWVFDANVVAKQSELEQIRQIEQTLRAGGNLGADDLQRNVRLVGLVNRTDAKGRLESDTVRDIVAHVRSESGIAQVFPYSALQVLALRGQDESADMVRELLPVLAEMGRATVTREVVKEGSRQVTVLHVMDSDGIERYQRRYQDLTAWAGPLQELEACVDEVRVEAHALLAEGIDRDLRALRQILHADVTVIEARAIEEADRYLAVLVDFEAFLHISKDRAREEIKESRTGFAQACITTLVSMVIDVSTEKGYIWNSRKLTIRHPDEKSLNYRLMQYVDVASAKNVITGNLLDFMAREAAKSPLRHPGLRGMSGLFWSIIAQACPHVNDKVDIAVQATLDVAIHDLLGELKRLDGNEVPGERPDANAKSDFAREACERVDFVAVHDWLTKVSDGFHESLLVQIADHRRQVGAIHNDITARAQRTRDEISR